MDLDAPAAPIQRVTAEMMTQLHRVVDDGHEHLGVVHDHAFGDEPHVHVHVSLDDQRPKARRLRGNT